MARLTSPQKELTIFGYAVFLLVCAIFAGAQPSWGKPAYALAFFAGVGISGPLSFLFAIARVSSRAAIALTEQSSRSTRLIRVSPWA